MTVTPEGIESLPLEYARTSFGNSTTFQDWVGATGTPAEKLATAKARAYMVQKLRGAYTLPCVVMDMAPIEGESIAVGAFERRGAVSVLFMDAVDPADTEPEDRALRFLNETGPIITDIEGLVGTENCLNVTATRRAERARMTDDDEDKKLGVRMYLAYYELEYFGA